MAKNTPSRSDSQPTDVLKRHHCAYHHRTHDALTYVNLKGMFAVAVTPAPARRMDSDLGVRRTDACRNCGHRSGQSRRVACKTLEEWYSIEYRNGGFAALRPRPSSDRNRGCILAEDIQKPGYEARRSSPPAHLIVRELEPAGRIRPA